MTTLPKLNACVCVVLVVKSMNVNLGNTRHDLQMLGKVRCAGKAESVIDSLISLVL